MSRVMFFWGLVCLVAIADVSASGKATSHSGVKVSPVQQVIQMLQDEATKGRKEKDEADVAFATYTAFCKGTREEKASSIAEAQDQIEQLQADIQKADADAAALQDEISAHNKDIAAWTAEKKHFQDIRDKEKADYMEEKEEYEASIAATDKALATLQQGSSFIQTGASLRTVSGLRKVPAAARKLIMSFLQRGPDQSLMQEAFLIAAPEAAAYKSSSGGIIDMVKDLGGKFKDEKAALDKEEAKAEYEFTMSVQDLTANIESTTSQVSMKTATKAKRVQSSADNSGLRDDTKTALAEDQKTLRDLSAECEQKSVEYEKEQGYRSGELKAIAKAIEIMSSDKVGGGTQHLSSLSQIKIALLQVGSSSQSPLQRRAAEFLNGRAQRSKSQILALIALKVKSDPFKKVTKMIQDMITKLMEEANEEAGHKAFCDTEMGMNKKTREIKTEESETLSAEVDGLSADIEKLASEIADLTMEMAEINAALKKATEERTDEKARNKKVIADSKVAEDATAQALAVLQDFYANAGDAPAFIQVTSKLAASGTDGIIGMLEVIESDFVRLGAETKAAEAKSQRSFDSFVNDSEQDKAVKTTSVNLKTDVKQDKTSALANAQKDLEATTVELDAAMKYFEELKPSCVEAGVSYEDRVARREEEIQSLKEALQILDETEFA